jgi:glycosyltransferase involved in cell wall biosynthesis
MWQTLFVEIKQSTKGGFPMSQDRVTIAIPTYNRAKLLGISLTSALEQDYKDIDVLVLDNASTDDTEHVVRSFDDSRITYIKNASNIGLYRNWNRAVALNNNPYLCILQDDDVLLPGFISASRNALEKYSSAAFSFTYAAGIDQDGNEVPIQNPSGVSGGKLNGCDYLHRIVAGQDFDIHVSAVMMTATALADIGLFDNGHSTHTIDFNLYFRFAANYDIAFIPEKFVQIRRHPGAYGIISFPGCGPVAMIAERMDAAAYLLQSARADDRTYRLWLAERLLHLGRLRSQYTSEQLPGMSLGWDEKLELTKNEIENMLPRKAKVILVDQGAMDPGAFDRHTILPFLEKNGTYWGPPATDADAIKEFEKLKRHKADYLVFAWSAFWWFDYYKEWRDYLVDQFQCIFKNSRLIVFALGQQTNSINTAKRLGKIQDVVA